MASIVLSSSCSPSAFTVEISSSPASDLESYAALYNGSSFDIKVLRFEKGEGILEINGKTVTFFAYLKNKTLEIWVNGKTYAFEILDQAKTPQRKVPEEEKSRHIISPMPGRILKVHVRTHDLVQAGQPLVVMESMKMEMTVAAPHAGKIQAVLSMQGQLVKTGQILMDLE